MQSSDSIHGFRLSPQQRRLWQLQQRLGDSPFEVKGALQITGDLDPEALRAALRAVVARHEILRTSFAVPDGMSLPLQVVHPAGNGARVLQSELVPVAAGQHRLLLTLPALVADVPSLSLLAGEIARTYGDFVQGRPDDDAGDDEALQYADIAEWLNQLAEADEARAERDWWLEQREAGGGARLPFERPEAPGDFAPRRLALPLDGETLRALDAFLRETGAGWHETLAVSWRALLHRLANREEMVLGLGSDGRDHEELSGMPGLFARYLPVRGRVDGSETFLELLEAHRQALAGACRRQDALAALADAEEDLPFLFEHHELPAGLRTAGVDFILTETYACTERFTASLCATSSGEALAVELRFDASRLTEDAAAILGEQWLALLRGLLADPSAPVGRLDCVGPRERALLLGPFGGTIPDGPEPRCVHHLFEAQVERAPDRVALRFQGAEVSYGALNARANLLARDLAALGVGPDRLVALYLDRSVEMIVALLAVLKAGGAYLPVETNYPAERIAYMLQDSGAGVLLTQSWLLPSLPAHGARIILLDEWAPAGSASDPAAPVLPSHLAYQIYTSGSTGRPKGCQIEHRSLFNYARWLTEHLLTDPGVGDFGLFTPLGFDFTCTALYGALLHGKSLFIYPQREEIGAILAHTFDPVTPVDAIKLTPSHATLLPSLGIAATNVRLVLTGGERLAEHHVRILRGLSPDLSLVNHYGPTETTVGCVSAPVPAEPAPVVIGRPLPGVRIHVVDSALRLVPVGVPGEICVAGHALARGYHGRPDLTVERFVPDPFGDGGRLYRTGDLGRWLADGTLEYLGRIDDQVKIRGFRVELGEIEARLRELDGVEDCAVVAREERNGDPLLVAYVVPAGEGVPAAAVLRDHLAVALPDWMVPARFIPVPGLPRTPNGKLDRKGLRELAAAPAPVESAGVDVAPLDPVEEILAGLWSGLLGTPVGPRDNFFHAGGHSLLATQAVYRIREALGVDLSLEDFFARPTIEDLAPLLRAARAAGLEPPDRLEPAPRTGDIPLSFAQQRLWFLWRLEGSSPTYNLPLALRLRGALDPRLLAECLGRLVERHEVLRTVFESAEGEPRQVILPPAPFLLEVEDLEGLAEPERRARVEAARADEAARGFDLERGPLFAARLLREGAESHVLLLTLHHIVADGWSLAVILEELKAGFGVKGEGALPELPVQYADFAVWQRAWLSGPVLERQLAWWRRLLEGAPALLDLPTDRPRPLWQSYRGATLRFRLEEELAARVRALGRDGGATLYMVLLAGFAALLARWSGQDDLVVGSPIANRNRREIEGLVGFFVNTLALRARVPRQGPFLALLRQVRETTLGAYTHQDLPFERLVEELQPERALSHAPLFQVMLVHQNVPMGRIELPGLRIETIEPGGGTTKFDLHLAIEEREGALTAVLDYGADLFDAATMERLAGHFRHLLAAASASPNEPVGTLDLLSPAERHQVVTAWNDTDFSVAGDLCIHHLFEAQAAIRPDAEAVRCRDRALTYARLDAWANGVAAALRQRGIGRGRFVALFLDRSLEMAAGVLGALKSGAAYVALDPSHPAERWRGVLEATGAAAILTRRELLDRLPVWPGETVCLDDPALEEGGEAPRDVHPGDLAYGVSTSGSTGRPKIILCRHRGVSSHLGFLLRRHGVGPEDTVLQLAPLSFDSSVRDLLGPLAAGARVVIAAEPADPRAVAAELEASGATAVMSVVPSFLEELTSAVSRRRSPTGRLRLLLVSGEALQPATCRAVWAAFGPQVRLVNQYGPTEATLTSTYHPIRPEELESRGVLVGRPADNVRVYVLRDGTPVPLGVYGEVFLGGIGLAAGYLGQPELTAQAFVPSPLAEVPGERLYRTGDLARWLPDGSLQFLGRADRQVKIRGVRVEPAEVEAALRAIPGVREAAVAAREEGPEGGPRLVAWVAGEEGELPAPAAFRERLRARLPETLIPSLVVPLAALPRTPNGKIDLQRLPAPAAERPAAAAAPLSPLSQAEELMAGLWAAVLGIEGAGPDDDFFALGGHSLRITRLVPRIEETFGVELPVRAVFERPTLRELTDHVLSLAAGGLVAREPIPKAPRAPEEGGLPLSFAQQRLWFLDRLEGRSAAYTIPLALRLWGGLEIAALAGALARIVERHEVLRTVFQEVDGQPFQSVLAPPQPSLPVVDLSALPPAARDQALEAALGAEADHVFDLATEPLFRWRLLRCGHREHVLLATLHHIVTDAWSTEVLVDEAARGYAALVRGEEPSLSPLPVQYADFAVWQRSWLAGEALATQEQYWLERLAGAPQRLQLPTDRPRPAVQSFRGAVHAFTLDGLAAPLRSLGRERGATLFMTLLAGFALLLSRYAGQEDVVVGTPVANRGRREVEPLIGLFANTLALRVTLAGRPSFAALLAAVRESTLGALAHQDLPFEALVEALAPERDLGLSPVFQVLFALQNLPPAVEMPGLTLEPLPRRSRTSRFDLSLFVEEGAEELSARFEHSADLFDGTTIARMADHLAILLGGAAAHPDLPVHLLPLLTAAERDEVLAGLRHTAGPYPAEPVHRRIAVQAARTPGRVAVRCGGRSLTYAELDAGAAGLARRLRQLGVGPGDRVALLVDRSVEMVTALLGILETGAAYLPLDPAFPRERLVYMLRDAGSALALTTPGLREIVREAGVPDLLLHRALAPAHRQDGAATGPEDLAYILYTSGSTGRPKGVQVHHGALGNFLHSMEGVFALGARDVFLSVTTLSFDIAGLEVFLPLLCGARLEIAEAATARDGAALAELIRDSGATAMQATPSTWRLLLAAGWEPAPPLRVLCGGEALPLDLARALRSGGARLWNLYGPTETTIWSTVHEVTAADLGLPTVSGYASIGRPIANTAVYLLDPFLSPVPAGVPGELWIGGDGVARGYHGRPELTAERFLPDPYSGVPGGRLYRTGDLARWLPGGRLEILGRADDQVKVRGYRVEPGEIEAALAALPLVRQAVVTARPGAGGETRLVAYVIPAGGPGTLDPAEVRRALRSTLPEAMVPAFVVPLASLPLTANGKVDRRALPDPAAADLAEVPFVAPRTPDEERMAVLWRDLLETEGFGVEHGFFELGGHSLLAARLVARIRGAFGVELPVRAVFEHPTIAGLCRQLWRQGALAADPIRPVPRTGPLPLSFAQRRLWFLAQFEGPGPSYNVPVVLRLAGPLDAAALEAALGFAVRRHESLRTVFEAVDGEPVQVILPDASAEMRRLDLTRLAPAEREEETGRIVAEEIRRPFDLAAGPLVRCLLVRRGEEDHVLILTFHHIICDAWSLGVLLDEVAGAYRAVSAGTLPATQPLAVQYADFAAWQNRRFAEGALAPQLDFWLRLLADAPRRTELPADRPRPARKGSRGEVRFFALQPDLAAALDTLGRARGATPFMVLLAGFLALLSRLSGEEDLVTGSPIANRHHEEIEPLVGLFANTLALRVRLEGAPSFAEAVDRVREVALAAQAHPELPFEKLVEELQPERDPGRTPLFNVVFAFQNAAGRRVELPQVQVTPLRQGTGTSKFDLLLVLEPEEGRLRGRFEYDADLFDAATIERLTGCFQTLLSAAVAAPETPVPDLPLLGEDERHLLLVESNDTWTAYPREAAVHRLFEEQVDRAPDAVAVEDEEGAALTYAALDVQANQLARGLARLGVRPGDGVALYLERSAGLVAALLGILKAGGAYVPLDPTYPAERLGFLVHDAGVRAVISTSAMAERLPDHGLPLLLLDEFADLPGDRPDLPVAPGDLAYVLYTSGSTGRPKGVGIPHRAVVRLVRETNFIRFHPGDVVAQAANASFDAATLELWGALLNGARLAIVSTGTVLTPRDFAARLADGSITTLWLTAGLFNQYSREVPAAFARLEWLLIGGEALDPAWVRRVLRTAPPRRLLNGYGPTECTTFSATHLIEEVPEGATTVPIGRPLANARLHVLDRRLGLQPLGVPGELYVGGDGLAVGYLGRPELTAERFVPDPFATVPGDRLYRTGDLVRRLGDGTLVFLGRADEQVKLRGFRIELGEVETALAALPEIAQAAVALREDEPGEKRLVAYLVLREGAEVEPGDLRRRLAGTLPEPMLPAAFVPLESLPLTPNGKLDRRALPRPGTRLAETGRVPPRTAMEKRVAGLWSELLGVDEPGVDDDFFVLGGHSLLVTRLASRLREALAVEVPVYVLFEQTTLAELAAWLEEAVRTAAPASGDDEPLVLGAHGAEAPLSFAQQRLWFLECLQGPGPAYNVPSGLRLRGELEAAALEGALERIVARHEILRTVFRQSAEGPVQVIAPAASFLLPVVDLQALPGEDREGERRRLAAAEAQAPFDLAAGPLLRARLLRLAPREHTLLVTLHHIVTDGWSMEVFYEELARGYLAACQGRDPGLPPLPVQYADFALWQRRRLRDRVLEEQLAFWRQRLAGAPERLPLPTDRPRPAVQSFRGAVERFVLEEELASRLRGLGQARDASLFMTLLAAFGVLLARHAGQDDVLVGAPIANRGRRELEPLIGFFANTLVLRVDLEGSPPFEEALGRVREMVLGAFAHQELPFEKLVEELQPERDLGYSPLFQAMLSLQNATRPLALPGLEVTAEGGGTGTAKFDLSLFLEEAPGGGLTGRLEYATDLFDAATARRMAGAFHALLAGIVESPASPVSRLPLLAAEARGQWLEGNRTAAPYLRGRCVHEDFEGWAGRAPERPAALLGGEVLTYADLDRRANRLAHVLRRLGVKPGVLVGIYLPRSLEMLEALLAILKAGGAYLPLDPANPRERLGLVLADAAPALVLTRSDLIPGLGAVGGKILRLDQIRELLRDEPDSRPAPLAGPEDLAYVIYTSGSTGRPKGVEIPHGALRNYVEWANRFYFGGGDWGDFGLFTSLAFDFTVTVVFCPLTRGRKLVVYGAEDAAAALSQALRAGSGVDTLKLTPSHVTLLESLDTGPTDVRLVILGGEACTPRHVETLRALRPDLEIVNEYGPTEATVGCIVERLEPGSPTVLIGRPIANMRAYVLDEGGGLVPAGVVGELHLAGDGLATGYRGNPDLTAERFVDADLGDGLRERLYRTGDLARLRADGRLELLGRRDSQVKIRGYRIELEEIEAALAGHPRVSAAVVAAWEPRPGERELAAYVVPAGPIAPDIDAIDLASSLRERLPEPMVPSRFLRLDALPLAASGKVDRRRLPSPEGLTAMVPVRPYVEPRTPGEQALARLWCEVLGVERVGAGNDFFTLGGHSLLAVRLMSRIHRELGHHLPLAEIFRHPTLERMAAALEGKESGQAWDVLVPIQSGEGAPVALVPGAGGNPLYFLPLARRLGSGHPVYGLQAVGLDGETPPLTTLEEVAARWVEALLRVHPAGPWTLVGHSFGGRAAYEMARQLLSQGVEVSRVVVLDAAAPDPRYAPPSGGWDDVRWIEEILGLIGKLGPVTPPEPGEIVALAPEARLERLRRGLEEAGLLPAGGSLLPVRGLIDVFRANHRIRYAPSVSAIENGPRPRIALVRAEQTGARALEEAGLGSLATDPALGWNAYSSAPVEVHTVPGGHMDMMAEPRVERLAALLEGWLAEVG